MSRETILQEVLAINSNNILLELATGTGKSRIALEKVKQLYNKSTAPNYELLVVIYRRVHKDNWIKELTKWWPNCPVNITFVTYASFHKISSSWDCIIFDECHHLTERCQEVLSKLTYIGSAILLSATVPLNLKGQLKTLFSNLAVYKRDLRDVIDSKILPDPKIYLFPLTLRTDIPTEVIWKNKSKGKSCIECTYRDKWKYIDRTDLPIKMYCTQRQYLSELNSQIDFWKRKYNNSRTLYTRNKWLRLCGERLKWLSNAKIEIIKSLLIYLNNSRTLTFCSTIEQTKILGKYCINSKNKNSGKILEDFNKGKIDHITACNMINEGMNLENCQIGIYTNLNSSEIIIKQRMGRLLRHTNPIIIIPYYKDSREEELVKEMIENYNPELVTTINSIEEIKI